MFVPDSTFSFGRGDYEWAELFMSAHDLKSKHFIVVIPRTICKLVDEETSKSHMKKLREVIERWVRKTGKKVVIAAEVRNDLPPARELVYDRLSNDAKRHCVMMQEYWTAEQASGLYRHARILISMELHSPLLALPEGTPVIVPTFKESGRKIWMLRDFKLGEYMFDIDSASTEEIEESLYQIHENYEDISNRIQAEVIPYLRKQEDRGMDVIGGILKNRRDE